MLVILYSIGVFIFLYKIKQEFLRVEEGLKIAFPSDNLTDSEYGDGAYDINVSTSNSTCQGIFDIFEDIITANIVLTAIVPFGLLHSLYHVLNIKLLETETEGNICLFAIVLLILGFAGSAAAVNDDISLNFVTCLEDEEKVDEFRRFYNHLKIFIVIPRVCLAAFVFSCFFYFKGIRNE